MSEMSETTCPRCGLDRLHPERGKNARSRKDNATWICSPCGLDESVSDGDPWPSHPRVYAPLQVRERQQLDALCEVARGTEGHRLAVMRVLYQGRHAAAACVVTEAEDGSTVDVHPIALLTDEEMFAEMKPLDDDHEVIGGGAS